MKILILLFTITINLLGQSSVSGIEQITHVDGDARNPFLPTFVNGYTYPNIYFEIHRDNISEIASIYYDQNTSKFSDPVYITDDSCLNINPQFAPLTSFSNLSGILFFQTNKHGNWQIAYKIKYDSIWSDTKFVDSSAVNETNPTLLLSNPYNYVDTLSIDILYEKNNSICIAAYRDNFFQTDEVFKGSDSVVYSQPTGALPAANYFGSSLYVAAKKGTAKKTLIVYKSKTDSSWSQEETAVDKGECNNPQFVLTDIFLTLTYENNFGGYSNIYFLTNWGTVEPPTVSDSLLDSLRGNLSGLKIAVTPPILTKQAKRNDHFFGDYSAFAYKYLIDDSTFVDVNADYFSSGYYRPDTLIYTKVKNTSLAVSFMQIGTDNSFTAWEDSVNGNIQLFGAGYSINLGAIKDKNSPATFQLNQNYPNPFNPSTKISFYLPHNSYVKLTVYDILGREAKQLINNFMYSGSHEITFDAASDGLTSGIYFYRLKAGDNVSVKKMVLLK